MEFVQAYSLFHMKMLGMIFAKQFRETLFDE
jgi:hypothetical protein